MAGTSHPAPPSATMGHGVHRATQGPPLCLRPALPLRLRRPLVFVVRYRRALLRPQVEAELVRLSREIGERYEIEVESVGADQDHAHLLCSAHPKIAPGDVARIYRSITAIQLFKSFPDLRRELWGGKFWSDGYFVSNAGPLGRWETLVRYIERQGQRPEAVNLRFLFTDPAADTGPHPDER